MEQSVGVGRTSEQAEAGEGKPDGTTPPDQTSGRGTEQAGEWVVVFDAFEGWIQYTYSMYSEAKLQYDKIVAENWDDVVLAKVIHAHEAK